VAWCGAFLLASVNALKQSPATRNRVFQCTDTGIRQHDAINTWPGALGQVNGSGQDPKRSNSDDKAESKQHSIASNNIMSTLSVSQSHEDQIMPGAESSIANIGSELEALKQTLAPFMQDSIDKQSGQDADDSKFLVSADVGIKTWNNNGSETGTIFTCLDGSSFLGEPGVGLNLDLGASNIGSPIVVGATTAGAFMILFFVSFMFVVWQVSILIRSYHHDLMASDGACVCFMSFCAFVVLLRADSTSMSTCSCLCRSVRCQSYSICLVICRVCLCLCRVCLFLRAPVILRMCRCFIQFNLFVLFCAFEYVLVQSYIFLYVDVRDCVFACVCMTLCVCVCLLYALGASVVLFVCVHACVRACVY
jgi:hypothetical protein